LACEWGLGEEYWYRFAVWFGKLSEPEMAHYPKYFPKPADLAMFWPYVPEKLEAHVGRTTQFLAQGPA
tara:strand:- start:12253 stop:12456 length:204 start_codon:yes stop_codon:yes gene_type:complete